MRADIESLKNIFNQMRNDGIDISRLNTWSFFFFDRSETNILLLKERLKNENRSIQIDQLNDGYWRLLITKERAYSVDQLHTQNLEYNKLVELLGVELYDGWNIEPSSH